MRRPSQRFRHQVQKSLARPHRNGFGQNLKLTLGSVFKDDKDPAVTPHVVQGLIFESDARNLGQPQRPIVVENDRKVFIHV